MPSSTFARLGVPAALADTLAERGITEPTPIQAATLPDSLSGRDVLGRGRTGSGKTYAFLLPVVARLVASGRRAGASRPRSVILAPTRELAVQIAEALDPLARAEGLTTLTVFGGVGQNPQVRALRSGVDVLVACPGRLLDLMGQGACQLDQVEITVLDEADHMADLGFLPGVRKILDATPRDAQRLLFSATLDAGIDVIVKRYLTNPVTHQTDSAQSPVSTMEHHVFHVTADDRIPVLADLASAPGRTVVFTRTKYGAKKLAKQLNARGVPSVELHGNLGQGARQRNLAAFHEGRATTLVATDIAARGIHVDDVALVVHADPPVEHKAYLHRAGRTARAGADGTVVTLMLDEQVKDVRALTKAARINPRTTRVTPEHPALREIAPGERVLVPGGLVLTPLQPEGRPAGQGRRSGGQGGGQHAGQERPARSSRSGRGRGGRTRTDAGRSRTASAAPTGGGSGSGRSPERRSTGGAAAFSTRSSTGRRSR